jgi:methionyl-tRNA formyltransferase
VNGPDPLTAPRVDADAPLSGADADAAPPPLDVVVMTQEDRFYIPRNVDILCRDPAVNVREIIVLDSAGSVRNRSGDLLRWFGPVAVARMALRAAFGIVRDGLDRVTGGRVPGAPASLKAVARRYGIPYAVERNANAPALLDRLERYGLDVVVSFSAPQVFRERLLRLPRLGCINLHCSLLPAYRGLLPSFWVLYHDEAESGATVHLMDAEIDNGGILKQARVDIGGMRTMDQVLSATKRAGGDVMLETLRELRRGPVEPLPNLSDEGGYFTWPTAEQARAFRRAGKRLI